MKKYKVTIPYSTLLTFKVEAESVDAAIDACDKLSWDDGDETWQGRDALRDVAVEVLP